ncbi:MAG TPA: hypothetical protein VGK85_06890 [Myxococcaceae bacterium]
MSSMSGGGPGASLFQVREARRRFLGPFLLVMVLHAGIFFLATRAVLVPIRPAPEPVKLVLRLPVRKVAVREPPGGGSPPPARHHPPRRIIRAPKEIPPPVVEKPPLPEIPDAPKVAEAEEATDDDGDEGEPGGSGAGGSGTGSGTGKGPGRGSIVSKARMAWLTHTDWRCLRPGHEDLGRIVVRIRVHVDPAGKPGPVTVVRPGPEDFNRRAVDCAMDESYVPALNPDGHPIPGDCEFAIEFLN